MRLEHVENVEAKPEMDGPATRADAAQAQPEDCQCQDANVSRASGIAQDLVGYADGNRGLGVRSARPGFSLVTVVYAPGVLVEITEEGEAAC